MPISILGEHISLLRHEKVKLPFLFKNEHLKIKYNKKSKLNKINSGKVKAFCLQLTSGKIAKFENIPEILPAFEKQGYLLESGRLIWK